MIELVALLRLIPYAIVGYIAYKKGFKWLTIAAVYLVCVALFNFLANPNDQVRGLLASGFAFFLVMHVLDLKPRGQGHDR